MDDSTIARAHADRLRALDPLLGAPVWTEDAEIVRVDGAVGRVGRHEAPPGSVGSLFSPHTTATLTVLLPDPPAEEAVDAVLRAWRPDLPTGDDETALSVRWPSRELVGPRSLVRHGFAPLSVLAVRRARTPLPDAGRAAAHGVEIRAARAEDLGRLRDWVVALHHTDTAWGVLNSRPDEAALLGDPLAGAVQHPDATVLVAQTADGPCGYLALDSAAGSAWVAPVTAAAPVRYLSAAYVEPAARSAGVGSALTAAALAEADRSGAAATLLHHGLPNPWSTPFWARAGFRPLWTSWQRRPAYR